MLTPQLKTFYRLEGAFMDEEEESLSLSYVLLMEDGNGQELFLNEEKKLTRLTEDPTARPFQVVTIFQVYGQLNALRRAYPSVCRFFALEYAEFETRRSNSPAI
ncbi:hypothetical protein IC229_32740 [Spirosoma sp. BT702]|uniref:Uncharacterized protein n=1 Tax=Spirosoma profusum TaxID=2771354 RepID=A0A927AW27_9BACT|nr:hypothetical protein [Spirosoma profusum]MBD2705424.1 hypothetical protein [Spirosoma profusum]